MIIFKIIRFILGFVFYLTTFVFLFTVFTVQSVLDPDNTDFYFSLTIVEPFYDFTGLL